MKKIIEFSSVYIVIAIILFVSSYYWEILPATNSLLNFSIFFSGILAPVTTGATIYITYLVYKLNSNDTKVELYFTKIVEIIFQIEDDYAHLKKEIIRSEKLKSKIKQNVILARYYLQRFPDKKCPINELNLVLNHIYFVPDKSEYYKTLADEFRSFCFYVNQDKQRPMSCKKDENGNFSLVQE